MPYPTLEAKNAARLQLARQCLDEGNLGAANILCRNVLDRQQDCATAWNLLGIVGARLQLWDQAAEYFRRAGDLGWDEAKANLQKIPATAVGWQNPHRGWFLLIKAWGAGFWSDVSHVFGGLVLAEVTGRKPVVHWGRNSRFGDGSNADAFGRFFAPVSEYAIEDLIALEDVDFYPPKWRRENLRDDDHMKWQGEGARLDAMLFLNRPEKVLVADYFLSVANLAPWIPASHALAGLSVTELYREMIRRYFRPQAAILDEAKAFFTAQLSDAPFIAAHIRGSDKVLEATFTTSSEAFRSHIAGEVFKILDRADPSRRIFLLTEDARIARAAVERYGGRIVMTASQRTNDDHGVHFRDDVDRVRLGIEVMIDVFIALQAGAFVGIGGSNVAAMIALLRDWPPQRCILLGQSVLLRRGQMPYLDRINAELETPDDA